MGRPRRIHLRIQVAPEHAAAFLPFLQEARKLYERPGGIQIGLLRDLQDPLRFIEVVEYDGPDSYDADQRRIAEDPEVVATLERWRALLAERAEVEIWEDVSDLLDADAVIGEIEGA